MEFNRRGEPGHERQANQVACYKRARARIAVPHKLHPGTFLRYLGLFLPGVARLSGCGYCSDRNHRMVIATSAHSTGLADVDLS
jgi:hypothetical protein